jgi:hypothetical protein
VAAKACPGKTQRNEKQRNEKQRNEKTGGIHTIEHKVSKTQNPKPKTPKKYFFLSYS